MNFCFRCGECCKGEIRLTREEISLIKERTGVELRGIQLEGNKVLVKVNPCPFLEGNLCTIYDIRPCACRMYHCGRLSPTDSPKKTIGEVREVMKKNNEYRLWLEQMQAEAAAWGNRHGWNWRKVG